MSNEETGAKCSGNVPQGTRLLHINELNRLEDLAEAAAVEAKKAKKAFKTQLELAEADGISPVGFEIARKILRTEGSDAFRSDMVEVGRTLRAARSPMGHQFDLLEQEPTEPLEDQWFGQGFRCRATGGDQADCPHPRNLPAGQAWMKGFAEADKLIMLEFERKLHDANAEEDDDDPAQTDLEDFTEPADVFEEPASEAEAIEEVGAE